MTNCVVDVGLLKEAAEPARAILDVETIDVAADKGYFQTEDIVACEKAGLIPYVPKPQRGSPAAKGFFRKDEYRYDPDCDAYTCPAGHAMKPIRPSKLRKMTRTDYANQRACQIAFCARCTGAEYHAVSRVEHEDALHRVAARMKERPEVLDVRRATVEHPFGTIKQWMNQGAFLMRGLEKVRAELSLTALVYNLRRALNIVGVDMLVRAVRA